MKVTHYKSNVAKLVREFKQLKAELFGDAMFVVLDDDNPKVKRYNELYIKLYLGGKFRAQLSIAERQRDDNEDCKLSPLCRCDDCQEQLNNEILPPDRI